MYDLAAIGAWLEFALRWVHVITAIAWIGSSFYFIALDLGLHRDRNLASGADGEEWQVHGGGFYHVQKYLVAPAAMPDDLIWFKWESYSTWLSGFAMLILVYYLGAEFYLVDPAVMDLAAWQAILISLGSLGFGWLAYDRICKSKFGDNNTRLMLALYLILVGLAYFYTHVFTGRAAMLHLGAFTATIMSANVFFIIMPNQRIVVADLKAGRVPDAKYGKIAKQRSTHNNYLTLPVIFMMLSNHYPLAFSTEWTWLIASLVFLMGVTIRHYFNSVHARKGNPTWTWAVTAVLFIVVMWLSTAPMFRDEPEEAQGAALRFAEAEGFEAVHDIVLGRCSMCHAAEPAWEGLLWPPKGVRLETEAQIARAARAIYLQAGLGHAMPPANLSFIEPEERAKIVAWYQAAVK
ncbi:urate hydroxylase PuuD [Pseudooceanicola sp.]|uniref:urate hydroxylase PuuD n=1 Tax=Pseudooceanicola sp. TaxID=1914328 RepID=UPI00262BD5F1|nr:urate hydroxylase PuuD [Pseudooceanicola sp.]MDF1856163.1 urate hydroxylase PuuD [Pseudooceanicola sp.]